MKRIVSGWVVLSTLSIAGCGVGTSAFMAASFPGTVGAIDNCVSSMSMSTCSSALQHLDSAPRPSEPFTVPSTTLTASANGNTYTLTYSVTTNSGTTMFDGQAAQSSAISVSVAENGSTIGTESSTAYYLKSPYVPLGLSGTVAGNAFEIIFNSIDPYPDTLTVGASGPLASGTFYAPGTNDALGSFAVSYAVEANTASTLLLKVSSSATLAGNPLPELISYAVDASGHMSLSSVQMTINGVTLSFH